MKTLVISIVTLLLATPAFARLNETEEQCTARYGTVVKREHNEKPSAEVCWYEPGKFRIKAYFLDGKVAALLVHKLDQSSFSKEEISLFLGAESGNATWIADRENSELLQKFRRSDERAEAVIIKMGALMIESVQWIAAEAGMSKF